MSKPRSIVPAPGRLFIAAAIAAGVLMLGACVSTSTSSHEHPKGPTPKHDHPQGEQPKGEHPKGETPKH